MHRHLSNSTRRLLSALVLAALVLVGRLAESIHSSQVGHVVCPEHGELLHVADAHGHASSTATDVPLGARVVPHAGAAEHHHCLLATLFWSSGSTWTPAQTAFSLRTLVEVRSVAHSECARFSLPPLSFAPKHSPPTSVA